MTVAQLIAALGVYGSDEEVRVTHAVAPVKNGMTILSVERSNDRTVVLVRA